MPAAEKPKAAAAVAEEHHPEKENAVEEVRYPRAQLVEAGVALLNTEPQFVAGALGAKPDQQTFTLAQGEQLVKEYLAKEHDPYAGVPDTYPRPDVEEG